MDVDKILGFIKLASNAVPTINLLYQIVEGVVGEVKNTLSETDAKKLEDGLEQMRADRLKRSETVSDALDDAAQLPLED